MITARRHYQNDAVTSLVRQLIEIRLAQIEAHRAPFWVRKWKGQY